MEPKFNTSFIPKKPVVDSPVSSGRRTETRNIFSVAATFLFVITLLATGGVFGYKIILKNQIKQADIDVNAARAAFEVDKIQDLIAANSRIKAAKNLLNKHIAVSELMELLRALTVRRLRFSTLTYRNTEGLHTLAMAAEAQGYNALAEQSDIFSKSEFIKNQIFSDFSLSDNGNVIVKFFANLDPSLTSYKKAVESLSLNN